jgi:hypothetical protein
MGRKGYKEIEKEDKEENEYALIEPDYRTRKFVSAPSQTGKENWRPRMLRGCTVSRWPLARMPILQEKVK